MKMKKLVTLLLLLMVSVSALLSFDAAVVLAKPNNGKGKPAPVVNTVRAFAEIEEEKEEIEEELEEVEEELEDGEELEEGEKPARPEKLKKAKKAAPAIANQYLKEMGIKRNLNGVNLIALLSESLATDPMLQTAVKEDREAYSAMVVEFIRTQHDLRMTLEPVITLE